MGGLSEGRWEEHEAGCIGSFGGYLTNYPCRDLADALPGKRNRLWSCDTSASISSDNTRVYKFDGVEKGQAIVQFVVTADLALFLKHRHQHPRKARPDVSRAS